MHIYITGVSKGLGKEFVDYFLSTGNTVTGIGRSHSFDHPNFSFIQCDLSNLNEVKSVQFDCKENEVVLINNAGVIGNIQRISDQHESDIQEVMTVNTISPMILCQEFLRQTALEKTLTIINISSGAANRPIPSWAAYCSSKIAMDRFSETIYLEEHEKGGGRCRHAVTEASPASGEQCYGGRGSCRDLAHTQVAGVSDNEAAVKVNVESARLRQQGAARRAAVARAAGTPVRCARKSIHERVRGGASNAKDNVGALVTQSKREGGPHAAKGGALRNCHNPKGRSQHERAQRRAVDKDTRCRSRGAAREQHERAIRQKPPKSLPRVLHNEDGAIH